MLIPHTDRHTASDSHKRTVARPSRQSDRRKLVDAVALREYATNAAAKTLFRRFSGSSKESFDSDKVPWRKGGVVFYEFCNSIVAVTSQNTQ